MDAEKKRGLISRLIISILFMLFIVSNTLLELGVPVEQPKGVVDKIQNMFLSVNEFFRDNRVLKHAISILTSLIIDVSGLYMILIWLAFMKNSRLLFSLLIFFFTKLVTQSIFQLKSPLNNLTEFPGFPSLFYSYKVNNYFLFSGTTGFEFILIYEFLQFSKVLKFSKIFAILNIVNLFIFSLFSLSIYALFTADILIGIIIAHYSIRLSLFIHPLFDERLFDNNAEKDYYEKFFGFLYIKGHLDEDSTNPNSPNLIKLDKKINNKLNPEILDLDNIKKSKDGNIIYNDECDMI